MRNDHIRWLYGELPDLVRGGVIPEVCAAHLRNHYGEVKTPNRRSYALIVCAVLGAALIGLGIILLFAHNWEDLPRPLRAVLAFTPLVAGQVLTGWTLLRHRGSLAWREGVALFLVTGIGAAIALIGQTYHIPGDLSSFLLTWALLAVPLVYLLDAVLPAVLYWVGLTFWAGYAQSDAGHAVLFWPLATIVLPFLWRTAKDRPYGPRALLLGWTLALCLCVATGITLEKVLPGLWVVVYCALFAGMYLLGNYAFHGSASFFSRPLHAVGAGGVAVVSLILSFEEPWRQVGWNYYRHGGRFHEWAAIQDYVLVLALLALTVTLLVHFLHDRRFDKVPMGFAGIVALFAWLAVSSGTPKMGPEVGMIFFNLYLFGLSIHLIVTGIRSTRLATLNGGLLMLTSLIVVRFFDSGLSFTFKGITFILIGVAFMVANLFARRMGDTQ